MNRPGPDGVQVALRRRIVLHCPDITLKGGNQREFQRQLAANVRQVLRCAGMDCSVGSARGRVYVESTGLDPAQLDLVMDRLSRVAGVASLGAATWIHPEQLFAGADLDWSLLETVTIDMATGVYAPDQTFAVRVNRTDKKVPVGSQQMEQRLGQVIRDHTQWERVDLEHPDRQFNIDAYPDGFYLYPEKRPGPGGLPVGTGGHVLCLLSGGIDSPVAAFMLARRGCTLDALHVAASHLREIDPEHSNVARLARELSHYALRIRLHIVPYTFFDLALRGGQDGHELVLFRRFMLRCGEYLAGRVHADGLVVGDSLGQVASQTMANMIAAGAAVAVPVFRPLVGFNKQEIIERARSIGTYGISVEPHKDCCALIGRHPRTRSTAARLAAMEGRLIPDYHALLQQTFAGALRLQYECGILRQVDDLDFAGGPDEAGGKFPETGYAPGK